MGYYKLTHETSSGVVKVTESTVEWTHVADRFFDFLLGCGFRLGRQDLADHYDQENKQKEFEDRVIEKQWVALEKLRHLHEKEAAAQESNHAEAYGMQPAEDYVIE